MQNYVTHSATVVPGCDLVNIQLYNYTSAGKYTNKPIVVRQFGPGVVWRHKSRFSDSDVETRRLGLTQATQK